MVCWAPRVPPASSAHSLRHSFPAGPSATLSLPCLPFPHLFCLFLLPLNMVFPSPSTGHQPLLRSLSCSFPSRRCVRGNDSPGHLQCAQQTIMLPFRGPPTAPRNPHLLMGREERQTRPASLPTPTPSTVLSPHSGPFGLGLYYMRWRDGSIWRHVAVLMRRKAPRPHYRSCTNTNM